jgi:hypothetical protein
MKGHWKKGLVVVVMGVAILGHVPAWAGRKSSTQVVINTTARQANGVLGNTRHSADPLQNIGCQVITTGVTGEQTLVECEARDRANNTLTCSSTNPAFVKVARALPDYGWLFFHTNSAGECIFLQAFVGSPYLP